MRGTATLDDDGSASVRRPGSGQLDAHRARRLAAVDPRATRARVKQMLCDLALHAKRKSTGSEAGRAKAMTALADVSSPSEFSSLAHVGGIFADGATCRHIATRIHGKVKKDREWVRKEVVVPLLEVGLLEKVYVSTAKELEDGQPLMVAGVHSTSKNSPNNAYRLSADAITLTCCAAEGYAAAMERFIAQSDVRRVRSKEAAAKAAAALAPNEHGRSSAPRSPR